MPGAALANFARFGSPLAAANYLKLTTAPELFLDVASPIVAGLRDLPKGYPVATMLERELQEYHEAAEADPTPDNTQRAWLARSRIIHVISGLSRDQWEKVAIHSSWEQTTRRFETGSELARKLRHLMSGQFSRDVLIDTSTLAARAAKLEKAGVPKEISTYVAEVELRMRFKLNLDPTAIQARADEFKKIFSNVTLDVPPAFYELSENQQEGLKLVGRAMRLLDPPFRIQSNPYGAVFEKLVMTTPALKPLRPYYVRWGGVFNFNEPDENHQYHGFLPGMEDIVRYPGGGMYPVGLTENEFRSHIPKGSSADRDMRAIFRFDQARRLVAIPYSQVFAEWLSPAADLLDQAAMYFDTDNAPMTNYLRTAARAFRTNDFETLDRVWIKLEAGPIDANIGAVEQYLDKLRGFLAQFLGVIHIRDTSLEPEIQRLRNAFPLFEENLPVLEKYKKPPEQRRAPPTFIVDNLFATGDENGGEVVARAFNRPNDERVRKTDGFRIVAMMNIAEAAAGTRASKVLKKLAIHFSQQDMVSLEALRHHTIFHELAHGNGVEFVVGQPDVAALRALGSLGNSFEELKADIVGLYNAKNAADNGIISADLLDQMYVSYIHRNILIVRNSGKAEDHARGALVALNYFQESRAIDINKETGETTVNLARMPDIISMFAQQLITIKGDGNRKEAEALYTRYGSNLPKGLENVFEAMAYLPKAIIYHYAFEDFLINH